MKKLLLGSSLGSFLLSSLLFFMVASASASADVGWLDRWDKRVKITVNSTNINAALTNFPVLIYLGTNSGENAEDVSFVFDELESDANQKKIAVTTSNGTSQCYVEIERWDHGTEQAWLWVKVPNVSSNADTDLYLYYDDDRPDNTNWVGDPNSTPAENVWDENFRGVWHLGESGSGIPDEFKDSTSNHFHGVGTSPMPTQVDGKIGKGQDAGIVSIANAGDINLINGQSELTLEAWAYIKNAVNYQTFFSHWANQFLFRIDSYFADGLKLYVMNSTNGLDEVHEGTKFEIDEWKYVVAVAKGNMHLKLYKNADEVATTDPTTFDSFRDLAEGLYFSDANDNFIYDEMRISKEARSAAWIKACYETQRDHLLDFGVEQKRPIPGTVMTIR